jgi:hypothetical protein
MHKKTFSLPTPLSFFQQGLVNGNVHNPALGEADFGDVPGPGSSKAGILERLLVQSQRLFEDASAQLSSKWRRRHHFEDIWAQASSKTFGFRQAAPPKRLPLKTRGRARLQPGGFTQTGVMDIHIW